MPERPGSGSRLRALRWQIALETAGYAVLVALPAVLVGFAAGLLAGAVVADAAGRPAGDAVRRALTRPGRAGRSCCWRSARSSS